MLFKDVQQVSICDPVYTPSFSDFECQFRRNYGPLVRMPKICNVHLICLIRKIHRLAAMMQLKGILANLETPIVEPPATLMSEDMDLINPSRWATS